MRQDLGRFLLSSSRRGKLLIFSGVVIAAAMASVVWMTERRLASL